MQMNLRTLCQMIRSNRVQNHARGSFRTCRSGNFRYLHNRKKRKDRNVRNNKFKAKAIPNSNKNNPNVNPKVDKSSPLGEHSSSAVSFSFWNRFLPTSTTQKQKHALERFLLFLPFAILINDEDYSPIPFQFQVMAGPSMIPTIYPTGEIYINIKSWFHKYATAIWSNLTSTKHHPINSAKIQNDHPWQVGDVVILKDFRGRKACKRITAVEGDSVNILGQYRYLYREEDEHGIRGRKEIISEGLPCQWREEVVSYDGEQHTTDTEIIINKNHVWVEGDNPLYSVDSRFYGPVHESQLLGKVIYRVWPRRRQLDDNSCVTNRERPHPIPEKEMFSGKYNIEKSPFVK